MRSLIIVCLALASFTVSAADWELVPNSNGTATVRWHTLPVVKMNYVAWGANWKWAPVKADEADGTLSGTIANLNATLSGSVEKLDERSLQWQLRWDIAEELSGVVGAGYEFTLNLEAPGLQAGEPELLAGNRGWRWEAAPGQAMEVRFARPVAHVYFERGQKNRIRTMLLGGDVPDGLHTFELTISLPKGGAVVPNVSERYGVTDSSAWPADLFAWDASPVDLSFLNNGHRPAGKHGKLRAEGERLVFEDGTVARFWGANLQAYALFKTKPENIPIQAKRLAQLGINLVRIHHHDSPWVTPNVFGDYPSVASTRSLDPEALQMLDRWIHAFKEEGIYVWLDLHAQRNLKAGDDIEHFAELAAKTGGTGRGQWADLKGYSYLNESITARMQEFTAHYLSHVNEFTRVAYKDEPAVVAVLITNENDVTHHFGNRFLPDKNVPQHTKLFDADRRAFSVRSGVPFDDTFKTWEPGPSKLYLNDLEHRWNQRMLTQLRALGVSVPIATTNFWGNNPAFSLPALADSTIMDTHAYGGSEELDYDPRYRASFFTQTALAAIVGKPVSISEWNVGRFPGRDRFSMPISTAAISSLQGWDAAMLYGYSQDALNGSQRGNNWSSYNDPAVMGVMPAAALLFRRGDVRVAERTYYLKFDRDTLFNRAIRGENSTTVRTLMEQHRLVVALPQVPELPWLQASSVPKGAQVVQDVDHDFLPAGQTYVTSDTGEVRRDWAAGIQTVDTPRSQIAVGWLGGKRIELSDVIVDVVTPKALVAVQSLEDEPVAESERILLTVMAQVAPSAGNKTPFRSQPVRGTVSVRAPPGLRLRPLGARGKRGDALTMVYRRGRYQIELPLEMPTHWYELAF